MAITQTGAIYKAFSFDNVSSRNYGVYITGEAVYNAPERDVEMINIPGRNGSFALDKGRFQNIEVTYPAGIFADTEADFAQAISDFRNLLCSRSGYVRLTDDYNPNEYRMAVYKSGLDVSPAQLKAGEFQLVFDCKPQRFLTSGEEAIDVDSGDTITNPTLFESSPMLEVEGYGSININDDTVTIQNEELGTIKISGGGTGSSMSLDTTQLNNGDTIFYNSAPYANVEVKAISGTLRITRNGAPTNGTCSISSVSTTVTRIFVLPSETTFSKGTNKTVTTSVPLHVIVNGTITDCTLTLTTSYNASTEKVTLSASWTSAPSTIKKTNDYIHNQYYGDSTKSILPSPMYIDLDIGEAYGVIDNEPLSFDNIVTLPAELPKLKSGANEVTFDNTVTDLKVVPRYWKI